MKPVSREAATVRTFSFLLITIGVYLLLWQSILIRHQLPVYYYARLIELLGILLFVALVLFTPMRFGEMGIVVPRSTLLRSLLLGASLSLLVVLALAAARLFSGEKVAFSWYVGGDISRVTYILVAPLQEVLAKSAMYYGFEQTLGRERPKRVVALCALTFGIFHVVYGVRMMLLSMALTLVTGWMFRRERCVWGCALLHFACGFLPGCFGFY